MGNFEVHCGTCIIKAAVGAFLEKVRKQDLEIGKWRDRAEKTEAEVKRLKDKLKRFEGAEAKVERSCFTCQYRVVANSSWPCCRCGPSTLSRWKSTDAFAANKVPRG